MGTARRVRQGDVEPSTVPTLWRQRLPGPQLPGLVTGITLMLGVWLVVAPSFWTYGDTGGGFDARSNDLLAGVAVTALAVARLVGSARLVTVTGAGLLLGGWLILAPFLLEYGFGADSTRATLSDVVVGVNLVGLTVLSYLDGRARNESRQPDEVPR